MEGPRGSPIFNPDQSLTMGDTPSPRERSSSDAPDEPARRVMPTSFPGHPPSDPWVIRRLICCVKSPLGKPTDRWSQEPIPTRFSPYPKPRPSGRLTEWRVIRAKAGSFTFSLLCMVQAAREDYRAWLVLEVDQRRSVVERWEYHGAHTPDGVHSHSWCAEADPPAGSLSIDAPRRLPRPRGFHRRRPHVMLSKEVFWVAACRRFRIDLVEIDQGELL